MQNLYNNAIKKNLVLFPSLHSEVREVPNRIAILVLRDPVVGAPDGDHHEVAQHQVGLDLARVSGGERGGVMAIGAKRKKRKDKDKRELLRCWHLEGLGWTEKDNSQRIWIMVVCCCLQSTIFPFPVLENDVLLVPWDT